MLPITPQSKVIQELKNNITYTNEKQKKKKLDNLLQNMRKKMK